MHIARRPEDSGADSRRLGSGVICRKLRKTILSTTAFVPQGFADGKKNQVLMDVPGNGPRWDVRVSWSPRSVFTQSNPGTGMSHAMPRYATRSGKRSPVEEKRCRLHKPVCWPKLARRKAFAADAYNARKQAKAVRELLARR